MIDEQGQDRGTLEDQPLAEPPRSVVMDQFEHQAAMLAVRLIRNNIPDIPIRYTSLEDVMADALVKAQAATKKLIIQLQMDPFDAETALARAEKGWLRAMGAVMAALVGGARTRDELVLWLEVALGLGKDEINGGET